ncbi:unnamed protein product [Closterium sp. Yama58-4]|nr:unnamed protein product [Closterium sp. Yama58-4]
MRLLLHFLLSNSPFPLSSALPPFQTTLFSRPLPVHRSSPLVQLTPVQALVGGTAASQQRRHHVVGVVAQLEDGRFFLEDLSASLPLDLSHAISALPSRTSPTPATITAQSHCLTLNLATHDHSHQAHDPHHLFSLTWLPPVSPLSLPVPLSLPSSFLFPRLFRCLPNSVVIASGQLTPSGCFNVSSLEFPPVEPRDEALSLVEGLDLFGAGPIDAHRYHGYVHVRMDACATLSLQVGACKLAVLLTPLPSSLMTLKPLLHPFFHLLPVLLSRHHAPHFPPLYIAPLPEPPAHEQAWVQQREAEAVEEGHMFIIMADIALHDPQTLSRLATVLGAYDALDHPPRLFLLIGDFCSPPTALASPHLHAHREAFSQLARVIGAHRRLKDKSLFVFVPGQADPGPCAVLPRPSLPRFFTEPITHALPSALFSSNPSRLKFYSQELVVLRADLQRRMQRCAVLPPLKDTDPFTHVATTVVHQAHLSPLPLAAQPVFWDYDFTLHLFPAPHVLILADSSAQSSAVVNDVICINPGSFSLDGTFTAYYPASRTVEHCNV